MKKLLVTSTIAISAVSSLVVAGIASADTSTSVQIIEFGGRDRHKISAQ
jgi:hypothetical protein